MFLAVFSQAWALAWWLDRRGARKPPGDRVFLFQPAALLAAAWALWRLFVTRGMPIGPEGHAVQGLAIATWFAGAAWTARWAWRAWRSRRAVRLAQRMGASSLAVFGALLAAWAFPLVSILWSAPLYCHG